MKKITIIAALVAAVAIASTIAVVNQLSGEILTANQTEAITSDGNDGSSLADTRTKVIATDKIPNDYLIDRTGTKWVEYYATQDTANDRIQWVRNLLSTATDSKVDQLSDNLSIREINFITLSENPDLDLDGVAALQVQYLKLSGLYMVSDREPIRKYHTYILGQYILPGTAEEVITKLDTMTGNLTTFAQDILDTRNIWAQRGIVPLGLDAGNEQYWAAVGALFDCEYEGVEDCAADSEFLENEAWNVDDGEFIPPPGEDWPPTFNFILPLAFATNYASMDYERTIYVYSCAGSICNEDWDGSSSTYYSDTWEPPSDCHLYGTGVKTTFEVDPEGLDFASAYLDVTAGYKSDDDLDYGNGIQRAIVTLTDIAQDPDAGWCYDSSFDYALDTN